MLKQKFVTWKLCLPVVCIVVGVTVVTLVGDTVGEVGVVTVVGIVVIGVVVVTTEYGIEIEQALQVCI